MLSKTKQSLKSFIQNTINSSISVLSESAIKAIVRQSIRRESSIYFDKLNAVFTHTIDGHRVFLDMHDPHITVHVMENGVWEEHSREAIRRYLPQEGVFVDIGANVGLLTMWAAICCGPRGKIYCFEPAPNTFKLLRLNIGLAGYQGLTQLENKAVFSETTELEFDYCEEAAGRSSLKLDPAVKTLFGTKGSKINVSAVKLDDYFPAGSKVDLIKADVEGFEYNVLLGANRLIQENPNLKFLLEHQAGTATNAVGSEGLKNFVNLIKKHKFSVFELKQYQKKLLVKIDYDDLYTISSADILLIRE